MKANRKTNVKSKVPVMILALLLITLFAAGCGGAADADDPNIGIWNATKVEMFGEEYDAQEIFDEGFTIELKAGGKCELRAEDGSDSYTWASEGDVVNISSGDEVLISATVTGGVMVIEDFMETGLLIRLEKEGAEQAPADDAGTEGDDQVATDGDENAKFTNAELKPIYEELSKAYDDSSLRELTYEEVRDTYFDGVDGDLYYETDTLSQYYWYVVGSDRDEYVMVTFQEYDGSGKQVGDGIGSHLP